MENRKKEGGKKRQKMEEKLEKLEKCWGKN